MNGFELDMFLSGSAYYGTKRTNKQYRTKLEILESYALILVPSLFYWELGVFYKMKEWYLLIS